VILRFKMILWGDSISRNTHTQKNKFKYYDIAILPAHGRSECRRLKKSKIKIIYIPFIIYNGFAITGIIYI